MRRLLFLFLALAPLACGGSQRASDADWTPEPQAKNKRLRDVEALGGGQVDPLENRAPALVGVRHDLMLSNDPHEARCNCLAVEVGAANDAKKFFWLGSPPDPGPDALTVAVGSRGVACAGGPSDDHQRRPSISAVDMIEDDVIIEVEDLPQGRPIASGAIIPKPGAKGAIYIRPHKNNAFYGRNPGVARCRVR
jgi:hypothetical protein